jgi:hypothetical protein
VLNHGNYCGSRRSRSDEPGSSLNVQVLPDIGALPDAPFPIPILYKSLPPGVEFPPLDKKDIIFFFIQVPCFFTLRSAGSGRVLHCWNPSWTSGLDICAILCFGTWEGLNERVGHSRRNISSQLG